MNKEEIEKPSFDNCLETIKEVCKGVPFNDEELHHRARLLFIMNRFNFWRELPVVLEEIEYQRGIVIESQQEGKLWTDADMRGFTNWLMKWYKPIKGGWKHRGAFNDRVKPVLIETLMEIYINDLKAMKE